jgi:hypothetical protein
MVVGPVFVIAEPAKTAKLEVDLRFTVGSAAKTVVGTLIRSTSAKVSSTAVILLCFIVLIVFHLFSTVFAL